MTTKLHDLDSYPEILNPKQIAKYLGIGYVKALRLLKSGSIPCVQIGNAYKVSRKQFESWLLEPGMRRFL